jgi:hypothetical protein
MSAGQMKHGSESFFIEGEGLLITQVGGRSGNEPDPMVQSDNPKAPATRDLPRAVAPPFRFTRVGPKGNPLNTTITKKLARAMVVGGGGTGTIPAGYTYLGQFVDHDLTMDRTDVMLGTDVAPIDLLQGRTWTRCTAPGRGMPSPRSSSTPMVSTSRSVRRSRRTA